MNDYWRLKRASAVVPNKNSPESLTLRMLYPGFHTNGRKISGRSGISRRK
jgi:hypothetical protein